MALINLAQIKNGKQLAEILQSYAAGKVTTNIAKAGDNAGNYSVEELLAELKSGVETADSLGAKKVKDVVRLVLPVTSSTTGEGDEAVTTYAATLPADLNERVPGLNGALVMPVYTTDNRTLFDENGNQLTLNMTTGAFSGVPSVVDVEASKAETGDTLVYKAANVDNVKVFPTGEWTLATLPADALLDNTEMSLIAYDAAINKLVVELAKDEDLINSIKELVGETAIATLLADKFDKANIVTSAVDRTVSGYTSSDEKVLSEKAADETFRAKADAIAFEDLEENLQNVIRTAATPEVFDPTSIIEEMDSMKADIAEAGKAEVYNNEKLSVASATVVQIANDAYDAEDETSGPENYKGVRFALTNEPNTKLVHMNINGIVYIEGDEFTVDRTNKTATWSEKDAFELTSEVAANVRIEYYSAPVAETPAEP